MTQKSTIHAADVPEPHCLGRLTRTTWHYNEWDFGEISPHDIIWSRAWGGGVFSSRMR